MSVDAFESKTNNEAADSRQRSTIAFPYKNQDDAITVARAIHSNTGHHPASFDQLAGWMGLSPKSSGFKVSISTAKMFGLITNATTGHYKLTDLGIKIVDPSRSQAARANSFLAVPLYKKVYETYQGSQLPPEAALERALTEMGVAAKQKDRARRVLIKSAEQAGFFATSDDRLILPAFASLPPAADKARKGNTPPPPQEEGSGGRGAGKGSGGSSGGGGGGGGGGHHPFIEGLLQTLPPEGSQWSGADRAKWLRLAAGAFDMIYEGDASISISEER